MTTETSIQKNMQNKTQPEIPVAQLPEKFKDPETGEIRLDALISSYLALEKKLSGSLPQPKDEDAKLNLLRHLGLPETPDQYDVNVSHGLFTPDPEVNARLHAKGLTPEQVQEVYDLAAEKMAPLIVDLAADFKADREVERLIEHFGGQEKWRQVSKQLLAFGKKNLPDDVLENLSRTYEGVLALYRMMKTQSPGMSGKSEASVPAGEAELQEMMRDPKYWRNKDPATVAKVTEGFRQLYGGK